MFRHEKIAPCEDRVFAWTTNSEHISPIAAWIDAHLEMHIASRSSCAAPAAEEINSDLVAYDVTVEVRDGKIVNIVISTCNTVKALGSFAESDYVPVCLKTPR